MENMNAEKTSVMDVFSTIGEILEIKKIEEIKKNLNCRTENRIKKISFSNNYLKIPKYNIINIFYVKPLRFVFL